MAKFVPYIPKDRKIEHKEEALTPTASRPLPMLLDDEAREGWEVISVHEFQDGGDALASTIITRYRCLFKRELRLEISDDC